MPRRPLRKSDRRDNHSHGLERWHGISLQGLHRRRQCLSHHPTLCAGSFHALSLRGDRTVWAWGSSSDGQVGDGTALVRVPVQAMLP